MKGRAVAWILLVAGMFLIMAGAIYIPSNRYDEHHTETVKGKYSEGGWFRSYYYLVYDKDGTPVSKSVTPAVYVVTNVGDPFNWSVSMYPNLWIGLILIGIGLLLVARIRPSDYE